VLRRLGLKSRAGAGGTAERVLDNEDKAVIARFVGLGGRGGNFGRMNEDEEEEEEEEEEATAGVERSEDPRGVIAGGGALDDLRAGIAGKEAVLRKVRPESVEASDEEDVCREME
jgi:hypothetical protein